MFCDDDRREARNALSSMPELYRQLRMAMVPSLGESAEPRVSGSKEAPLPLRLEALAQAEEIAQHLATFEDSLRIFLGEPGFGRRSGWTVRLETGPEPKGPMIFAGTDRVRAEAMRRLYAKRGHPTVLVGEWPDEGRRRDAVNHPTEAAQVDAAGSWLLARLDVLLSSPLAVSVARELMVLKRHARLILGLGSGDVVLPIPCPEPECRQERLVRENGKDYVECMACGLVERDLVRFMRVLAVDMPDLLLPQARAAEFVGTKPGNLTAWDARGHLEHQGCDVRTKRKLYRVGDVLRLAARSA